MTLPTIWHVPDELWKSILPLLDELDPPRKQGRKRVSARAILDAIIFRLRTGCQWKHLPKEFPDDSTVHRTFQRWIRKHVCLDKGYDNPTGHTAVEKYGYIPHIRRIREERKT